MDVERQVTALSSLQCHTGHTLDSRKEEKECVGEEDGVVHHAKRR